MPATYAAIKRAVIDVVDDFASKDDVVDNYKPSGGKLYDAKTKLITLYINDPVLAMMPIRFNKALRKVAGSGWKNVGSLDLMKKKTIGDLIKLACSAAKVTVSAGEPT
ncbi:hypothetical protein [Ramlibacter sp. Leaf400]|uniref:hypothetical protein n=1 Tax=Ramlibacter sp. Leaf400 TaxID=1736365 RepID=UPI0006FB01BC|nr:hypothetical protein [Ramlibacter sp. Leaf400]KQT10948.1 hypothetical protein ASG30_09115 [Ramlibacter sp. Leaf400]